MLPQHVRLGRRSSQEHVGGLEEKRADVLAEGERRGAVAAGLGQPAAHRRRQRRHRPAARSQRLIRPAKLFQHPGPLPFPAVQGIRVFLGSQDRLTREAQGRGVLALGLFQGPPVPGSRGLQSPVAKSAGYAEGIGESLARQKCLRRGPRIPSANILLVITRKMCRGLLWSPLPVLRERVRAPSLSRSTGRGRKSGMFR